MDFIQTFSYRKVTKMAGIIGSQAGKWAIIGNECWSYNLASLKKDTLYLNSFFISGYEGSNYAGQKGATHYTEEMLKAIKELDNTFSTKTGVATSKQYKIEIVEFGTRK